MIIDERSYRDSLRLLNRMYALRTGIIDEGKALQLLGEIPAMLGEGKVAEEPLPAPCVTVKVPVP